MSADLAADCRASKTSRGVRSLPLGEIRIACGDVLMSRSYDCRREGVKGAEELFSTKSKGNAKESRGDPMESRGEAMEFKSMG